MKSNFSVTLSLLLFRRVGIIYHTNDREFAGKVLNLIPKSTGLCGGDDGVRFHSHTVFWCGNERAEGGKPSLRFDFGAFFFWLLFFFAQKRKVTNASRMIKHK